MARLVEEIKEMKVPRLFRSLSAWKKTGTAVFLRPETVANVYFKDGDMIFASSKPEAQALGAYLLQRGTITGTQYAVTAEIAKKTSKQQEALLVELGFITPRDLVDGIRGTVKGVILGLFLWNDGTFQFEDGQLPLDDIIPLRMSTGNLILAGIDQIDWKTIRRSLPPLNTILRPATNVASLFQSIALSPEQKNILSLINGKRSIEELCAGSCTGDYNTLKTLYTFLTLQMVVIGAITTEEEAVFAQEAVHAAVSDVPAPSVAVDAAAVKNNIRKAFEEMEKQDHYQALGLTETAGPVEIKKAFFRLSKVYHPDRHFDAEMADMKSTLEALFIRIHEAYTTLSHPEKRAEYDAVRAAGGGEKKSGQEQAVRPDSAEIQFERGVQEYHVRNYWGALELFEWACRLNPGKAEFFYYQGLTLFQMPRRWLEAEEPFKRAVELDPDKAEYYIALGNFHLKNGQKPQALSQFREALKREPGSLPAKQGDAAARA